MEKPISFFEPPESELHYPDSVNCFLIKNPHMMQYSPDEQLKLYRHFGINPKTEFFRDENVLDALENTIFPEYSNDKKLRIASVGCSVGKEPYSLLAKNWAHRNKLHIHGYDANPANIAQAINGIYEISDEDLRKFENFGLIDTNDIYSIIDDGDNRYVHFNDSAKSRIIFNIHDVMDSPLPEKYNVALILNVLPHYPKKGRDRIISNLYDSIDCDGWLVIEKPIQTSKQHNKDYINWLNDLRYLGFEKMEISSQYPVSCTNFPQIYRKREVLKTSKFLLNNDLN